MMNATFGEICLWVLSDSGIHALVESRPSIVLERLARGGGATRWYHLPRQGDVAQIASRLSPGSSVSFYFDNRFAWCRPGDPYEQRVRSVLATTGETVVAEVVDDDPELLLHLVAGEADLAELTTDLASNRSLFIGSFPMRDSDGIDAVTIDLPDRDGVIRHHPH